MLAKRAAAGITQSELADRMGLEARTVRAIEKGRSVASTTVAAIDTAFDLPIGTARRVLEEGFDEPAAEPTSPPAPTVDREHLRARLRAHIARLERLYLEIDEVFAEGDELHALLGEIGSDIRPTG